MTPTKDNPEVYSFMLGNWAIACFAMSKRDAQSYIKRRYNGQAKYIGEGCNNPLACGHITPDREAFIREENERFMKQEF